MTDDAQFQYVQGQARTTFPRLFAAYEAESQAALEDESCEPDLRYGPAERQTFDFFAARAKPRGTLVYFHAGYWQSRDKSGFRFIAPAYAAAGINVALVNYPLCPSVSVPELVEAARACVAEVRTHAEKAAAAAGASSASSASSAEWAAGCADASRLLLSGHSAGGHIAIELALSAEAPAVSGVVGVVALSGIYDLAPLLTTSLNDKLGLDRDSARACSPVHRVRAGAAPALLVVGGDETPAFVAQSRRMHDAWSAGGNRSALHVEAGADHFSLLRSLSSAGSPLFERVAAMLPGSAS